VKYVFLGGPGRSGTSAVAERLRVFPGVGSFLDAELKIFSEADGVSDLYWNFVKCYSPQRTPVSWRRFVLLFNSLYKDAPGAVGLKKYVSRAEWDEPVRALYTTLFHDTGIARRMAEKDFFEAIASFLDQVASLYEGASDSSEKIELFVEKTPHNILRVSHLSRLPRELIFIHVMRDPRIIAASLHNQWWGPNTLLESSCWLREYCDEFSQACQWAKSHAVDIRQFYIEGIAMKQDESAQLMADLLGVECLHPIFYDLDVNQLRKTASKIEPKDIDFLNGFFEQEVATFGYDPSQIGLPLNCS